MLILCAYVRLSCLVVLVVVVLRLPATELIELRNGFNQIRGGKLAAASLEPPRFRIFAPLDFVIVVLFESSSGNHCRAATSLLTSELDQPVDGKH